MRQIKLAVFLALLASISFQAQAQAQDLLNPMALGESMSMPLPPDLVRQAESAGVKVGNAPIGSSSETSGLAPVALGSGAADQGIESTQPWSNAGADASSAGAGAQVQGDPVPSDVNVSGMWTFTLQDDLIRHLDLALFQNGNAILGYGNLQSENSTKGVTAGGSVDNGRVSILITSQGGLSMYRLNMVPSQSSLSGSYSAFTSSGDTWSGTISGSMPGQEPQVEAAARSQAVPDASSQAQSPAGSSTKSSLSPVMIGGTSSTGAGASSSISSGSYGTSSRSGSSFSSGGMSSSQSVSMGGGGSYSSVSSISSSVYG